MSYLEPKCILCGEEPSLVVDDYPAKEENLTHYCRKCWDEIWSEKNGN